MDGAQHAGLVGHHQGRAAGAGDALHVRGHGLGKTSAREGRHRCGCSLSQVASGGKIDSAHARLGGERMEDGTRKDGIRHRVSASGGQVHDAAPLRSLVGKRAQKRRQRQVGLVHAGSRMEIHRLPVAHGDGACLVQQQHVHVARGFHRPARGGQDVSLGEPVDSRDTDGRKQSSDGGRDQAHQQADKNRHRNVDPHPFGQRVEGPNHQEKDQREGRKQDGKGDFVGRLLALGAFDQGDHAVHEPFARIGRHADHQPIGKHGGAARDSRSVATGLADHRCGFAGDGRFVYRRGTFHHLAVGGNGLARHDHHQIVLAQRLGRHLLQFVARPHPESRDALARFAQGVCLGLASTFRHRLGEVGEQHGEPEPRRDLRGETQRLVSIGQKEQIQRHQDRSHRRGEHHRIAPEDVGLEFDHALPESRSEDVLVEQLAIGLFHGLAFRTGGWIRSSGSVQGPGRAPRPGSR